MVKIITDWNLNKIIVNFVGTPGLIGSNRGIVDQRMYDCYRKGQERTCPCTSKKGGVRFVCKRPCEWGKVTARKGCKLRGGNESCLHACAIDRVAFKRSHSVFCWVFFWGGMRRRWVKKQFRCWSGKLKTIARQRSHQLFEFLDCRLRMMEGGSERFNREIPTPHEDASQDQSVYFVHRRLYEASHFKAASRARTVPYQGDNFANSKMDNFSLIFKTS